MELGSEGLGKGGRGRRSWGRGFGVGVVRVGDEGVGVGGGGVRGVGVGSLGSEGFGSRRIGEVGVGKVVVLASNSPGIKSSSRQIVMYPWAFGANGTCLPQSFNAHLLWCSFFLVAISPQCSFAINYQVLSQCPLVPKCPFAS